MPASLPQNTSRVLFLLLGVALAPVAAQDAEPKAIKKREPTKFIRVQHDEFKNPQSLQTATVKYVLKDDDGEVRLEVTLESAVHIADRAYYRGFNRRFENYDAVLYELIASPEKRVPNEKQGQPHPAKIVQQLMGDSLGFAHQIDSIDYKAENMVHSDLSPAEMKAARRKRGDDDVMMLADAVVDMLRQVSRKADDKDDPDDVDDVLELLDLDFLSDPDSGIKLRRMLARSFDSSSSPQNLLRPTQVRSLIDDRNERAMKVFQEQVDEGKRHIAFFWGAAHMPDLERRLVLGYGMQRESVRWRNAWDLREGAVERAPLDSILEKTLRSVLDDALDELFERQKP